MSAPTLAPLLEAEALTVRYGAREVLRDVSLRVGRGELLAIIGPNGSGKSTLLRLLARLQRPAAGSVRLGGVDLWALSPRAVARHVAFLPQAPEAPPDLTVEELAWHGRHPHRRLLAPATAADAAAVERALAQADLAALRARPLRTLSGGERQRAWVALALAQEPELLLLDEPTTFLDLGHQHELLRLLRTLNAERGLTVVMVMHDVAQAAQYAPRMLALHEGRVLLDGPPGQVVTPEHLARLFGVRLAVLRDPASGAPALVPEAPGT
jgi:iron complex transport system ATP-binding protein